jgi:hypothetical protein
LRAEFSSIYEKSSTESIQKCSSLGNPRNYSETTPAQQKCYEDVWDKYGIFDKKYDSVRTDVMLEYSDRLIEETDRLIDDLLK